MARATSTTSALRPVTAVARVDRRTKNLVKRLEAGDIAVINHRDVDAVAAETLLQAQPSAIVNADAFSSGRYPNQGPIMLLDAGIVLVDRVGPEIMERIAEGDEITVRAGEVYQGDDVIARGVAVDEAEIESIHRVAEERLSEEFHLFVDNTLSYLERDKADLIDEIDLPKVHTDFAGRHALIVVRGASYQDDLNILRVSGYLNEMKPVLIGVDGGADALMQLGLTPDVIIGDFDSVTDHTLRSGAELVVHAYKDGRAPGAARLDDLGLKYHTWATSGTSEDIAMLLAYDLGAELIVAVGTHSSMVEFLEKGRAGMASTVLVRMKVGTHLVDAKGVSRLYRQQVKKRDLALVVIAALVALITVMLISAPIRLYLRTAWANLTNVLPIVLGLIR